MSRLVRCDRCNKEVNLDEPDAFTNMDLPVLNTDGLSSDEKGFDFCFQCLKSLWDWLRQGQHDARRK